MRWVSNENINGALATFDKAASFSRGNMLLLSMYARSSLLLHHCIVTEHFEDRSSLR
jgi:hypothetical protein